MTYEEAYKICKEVDCHNKIITEAESHEFWEVITKSLQRHIPKKPIDQGTIGRKDKYKYGYCQTCQNGVNYEMQYCDNCGQRLDWSEKE